MFYCRNVWLTCWQHNIECELTVHMYKHPAQSGNVNLQLHACDNDNKETLWDFPDSKDHWANMGPTWVLWAPCWSHKPCYQGWYVQPHVLSHTVWCTSNINMFITTDWIWNDMYGWDVLVVWKIIVMRAILWTNAKYPFIWKHEIVDHVI